MSATNIHGRQREEMRRVIYTNAFNDDNSIKDRMSDSKRFICVQAGRPL